MTLVQLNMLVAVADQGTLKKASEALFKTQPALSQGLKQLEDRLQVELFNREGYRLTLTSAGQQIYQQATRVLNESRTLSQMAQHLAQGNEPLVKLTFEASFDLQRILPALELTQNEFPHTRIVIQQEYVTGALEAVTNEQTDLGITPVPGGLFETEPLDNVPLYKSGLVNVAAPRLLMKYPNLTSVQQLINEYQLVIKDTGTGTKDFELGVQKGQRRWYVSDFGTKLDLIKSGMGWGKLPLTLIEEDLDKGHLERLALTDAYNWIDTEYHVIKLKHKVLGPVALKLWHNFQLLGQQNR